MSFSHTQNIGGEMAWKVLTYHDSLWYTLYMRGEEWETRNWSTLTTE